MGFMGGLEQATVRANGIRVNLWTGGKGKPVLLPHGYPQTAQMWHKLAPRLAEEFCVVCPDLRGYGDSDKPAGDQPKAVTRLCVLAIRAGLAIWGVADLRPFLRA